MLGWNRKIFLNIVLAISLLFVPSAYAIDNTLTPEDTAKIGVDAYIYAYPLVRMNITRQVMTNVANSMERFAPVGQFSHMTRFPDLNSKEVVAPNVDTLFSVAWLDLSQQPYILHLPNEGKRYYSMQMLDAWTNTLAVPGSRIISGKERNYAIVGPNWFGALPKDLKNVIKSPTNTVWIIGRTYCSGTPEDYQAVDTIQKQYTLTPLKYYGNPYTPPTKVATDASVRKTSPAIQVARMDATTFFSKLAMLLKSNPPAAADELMVANLTRIGIIPGQLFDNRNVDPNISMSLNAATKNGLAEIEKNISRTRRLVNGWQILSGSGNYGTNYLRRAVIAYIGLGASLPQDAIYPIASTDEDGDELSGQNNYVLHFARKRIPPVNAFWSLTMYNDDYFLVANSLNRYHLTSFNKFKYNDDGSLDIYIQQNSPDEDHAVNWLPAPAGKFHVMLRLYSPRAIALNGIWQPPPIKKASPLGWLQRSFY